MSGIHHIPNILFNRQREVLEKYIKYMNDELNPSSITSLNRNANALMMPALLGGVSLISQLIYAVKKQLLTPDEFILLIFYAMALTRALEGLTRRTIDGISSFGLLFKVLTYINQASQLGSNELVVGPLPPTIKIENVSYGFPHTDKKVLM